jgi:SNF2 family DNA or RNA helicase
MIETLDVKLITETSKGTRIKSAATLGFNRGRIEFIKSPFSLKDEIKAMKGSKWHGFDDPPRKIWSVDDCPRNRFQLEYMKGENPYEWFDQEIVPRKYRRPLMPHQCDLADYGLTYHYSIWAAEMGTGKTLSAITVIEESGVEEWIWVGPKASLKAIQREFKKWELDPRIKVELMTYEGLARLMDEWPTDKKPPRGVIVDESSRCKTATTNRTRAVQKLADLIRHHYGFDGYVILMSGTPSPKTPVDWWSQAEIAWPGFLKEGSPKALEQRLAFLREERYESGAFQKRFGWKDNELKCNKCGLLEHEGPHNLEEPDDLADFHAYEPSKNEVSLMYDRLIGLVVIKHKKDCLDLPDKRYRKIICKPNSSTIRVAQALVNTAPNAMQGAALLRELSDGFQYRQEEDGMTACTHCAASGQVEEWFDPNDEDRTFAAVDMLNPELVSMLEKHVVTCPACGGDKEVKKYKRITREVPCPKEAALIQLLEENEEHGRILVFAGFTGSVDRCVNICTKQRWDVVRCDGRGFQVFKVHSDGTVETLPRQDALDYWANMDNERVAFVAHPESGGMGLTLTEANTAVFWSNSFKPEYRPQSEDRIHRKGMDVNLGATIVDLIHLPTDERVLEVIRENRKLELMTLGELKEGLTEDAAGDGELIEA